MFGSLGWEELLIVMVIFAVVVIPGLLFGWWGAHVTTHKGRSGPLGFALGFFLGIIGVVLAYLVSPSAEVQLIRMEQQAEAIERARQRVSREVER